MKKLILYFLISFLTDFTFLTMDTFNNKIKTYQDLYSYYEEKIKMLKDLLREICNQKHDLHIENEFYNITGRNMLTSIHFYSNAAALSQIQSDINMILQESAEYRNMYTSLKNKSVELIHYASHKLEALEKTLFRLREEKNLDGNKFGSSSLRTFLYWKSKLYQLIPKLENGLEEIELFRKRAEADIDFMNEIVLQLSINNSDDTNVNYDDDDANDDTNDDTNDDDISFANQIFYRETTPLKKKNPLLSTKLLEKEMAQTTKWNCVLCLENQTLTVFSTFSCQHSFCTYCIVQHLKSSCHYNDTDLYHSCPLCRQEISEIIINYNHDINGPANVVMNSSILLPYCNLKV